MNQLTKTYIIKHKIKNIRNDVFLSFHLRRKSPDSQNVINSLLINKTKNILFVVAFERPEVLELCLLAAKKFVSNCTIVVLDNSNSQLKRNQIRSLCQDLRHLYISLPTYCSKSPNRSHGMAMSWAYEHIVKKKPIESFGFIDHDLIALKKSNPFNHLCSQKCYGSINEGIKSWHLWAGYCFFRASSLKNYKVSFLYDFSRALDTGGRLSLYSDISKDKLKFASDEIKSLKKGSVKNNSSVQIIDNSWLHIGGVSYNNNFAIKQELIQLIKKTIYEEGHILLE